MELEGDIGIDNERGHKEHERNAVRRPGPVAFYKEENNQRQGREDEQIEKISGKKLPHDLAGRVPAVGFEDRRRDDEGEERHAPDPEGEDEIIE